MSKKLGILIIVIAIFVFGFIIFRELTVWILAGLGKILLVTAVVVTIVNVVYYLFFDNNVENFKTPARMIALTGILVILWWFGISFFGFPMWIPVSVWGGLTVLVTAGIALIYRHDKVSLDKKKMENEEEESDSEKRNDETEDEQNAERSKLLERYNAVMPRVKKYLDSVGFTLPENENIFFWKLMKAMESGNFKVMKKPLTTSFSKILHTPGPVASC